MTTRQQAPRSQTTNSVIVRMKNDGPQRKRFFVAEAMSHPAAFDERLRFEEVIAVRKPGANA